MLSGKDLHEVTYPELAQGILDVDTAGWAESWEVLRKRIIEGFTAMAEDLERSVVVMLSSLVMV